MSEIIKRILLPLFPYPSWVQVVRCAIGAPETAASMAISILCKLPPPFFETVLTFEVQHIRTAAAGRSQKENQIERHSSVSLRAGFSFAVRKGAFVSRRLRAGKEA